MLVGGECGPPSLPSLGRNDLEDILNKTSIGSLAASFAISFALSATTPPAMAAAPSADANATIHELIDAFNKGDNKTFFAGFVKGSVTITDEYSPHLWNGPNAVKQWSDAYDKDAKEKNITDPALPYNEPTRSEADGKTAYVIMPSTYSYKQNGIATAEEGQMTFVLNMTPQGWKIRAFTWSGVVPHPVK